MNDLKESLDRMKVSPVINTGSTPEVSNTNMSDVLRQREEIHSQKLNLQAQIYVAESR